MRLWYDFFFMHTLNTNFRYAVQTNFKHQTEGHWKQVMIRPALIYTMRDELYLQAGLSVLFTWNGDENIYEIRPWQGVNIFFPRIGQIFINNFIRLEERIFLFSNDYDHSASIRARYSVATQIPLNHYQIIDHTVYLWPQIEAFIPIYDQGFTPYVDQFRFSLGLGYRFNGHIRSEFAYMYEKSKVEETHNFSENSSTIRVILRYLLSNGQKPTVL